MKVFFKGHNFKYDLEHIIRMFCDDISFESSLLTKTERNDPSNYVYFRYLSNHAVKQVFVVLSYEGTIKASFRRLDILTTNTEVKRFLAREFYDMMSDILKVYPPWGILTGVRPLKIVTSSIGNNIPKEQIISLLQEEYLVREEKAEIAYEAATNSMEVAKSNTKNSCSVYISIPFCPSRCDYCSFVSKSIEREFALVDEYIEKLLEEIAIISKIIAKHKLSIKSIYVGGGTPTVLNEGLIERLCNAINQYLPIVGNIEYTYEAGRPDTITTGKLEILKKNGVTRISINPQTFSDKVLATIGRRHTGKDIYKAFEIAKKVGINNINADLIAGLPRDSYEGFCDSLDKLVELRPTAITVHALTIKRAGQLKEQKITLPKDAAKMVATAYETLKSHEYHPYYLYRQKGTLENLENIGYSQRGYEGLYNVYIMEELHTIFSAGAGGVTKIVNQDSGKIERIFNYKYPLDFIKNFEMVLERKSKTEQLFY